MEENKIKLPSRCETTDTTAIKLENNKYVVTTNSLYVRHILGKENVGIEAIDFDGGPYLQVGLEYKPLGGKIKKITESYIIEIEQ